MEYGFIQRAKDLLKDAVKEARENKCLHRRKLYEENRERYTSYREKYESSEKGKEKRLEVSRKRWERFKAACADLSEEEFYKIEEFYEKCPQGYHVDHIIPIALGGLHRISNLQYLTAHENFKKGTKEKWEPDDYSKVEYKSMRREYRPRKKG